jgi:hypothetical protein
VTSGAAELLAVLARVTLAAVFAYAAAGKLAHRGAFAGTLRA